MIGGSDRVTVDLYACADCESVHIDRFDIKGHEKHAKFKRTLRRVTEIQINMAVHKARESMQKNWLPQGFRPLRLA